MEMTAPSKVTDSSNAKTSMGMSMLHEDLLQNILARLPAPSIAFAACVSKSWNSLCNRILSRPKISSAISFNPSLGDAVNEVIYKVLSEPIRPYFAIANVGITLSAAKTLQLIRRSFGSNIPIVVVVGSGILGKNAIADGFTEIKWDALFNSFGETESDRLLNEGLVLTVATCLR